MIAYVELLAGIGIGLFISYKLLIKPLLEKQATEAKQLEEKKKEPEDRV